MRNKKTTLLLSAGIGITPMISIAKQALAESQRLRTQFPMLLIASVTNRAEQTFLQELHDIQRQSAGMIQILWCITKNSTQESSTRGNNSHSLGEHLILGRITRKLLSDTFFAQIPANDVDVYVCGPTGFMQSMYDDLRSLEVPDTNIHAEAFGPASFQRDSSSAENDRLIEQLNLPEQATITVENAVGEISMEQRWTPEDGNLLDFSEKHGLIPNFSCRNGQCGSCKSQLVSGSIAHTSTGHLPIESDELLLCCAQPTSEDVVIKLSS